MTKCRLTTRQLNEAAQEHARKQLGDVQFERNKDAVRAICADFKAGYEAGFQAELVVVAVSPSQSTTATSHD